MSSFIIKTPERILYPRKEETILETMERYNCEVEYQCRRGYCGYCKMRLLHGEVEYLEEPLGYTTNDEILICCSNPKSDISIEPIEIKIKK